MTQLRLPLPIAGRSRHTMAAWAIALACKQHRYDQRDAALMLRLTQTRKS